MKRKFIVNILVVVNDEEQYSIWPEFREIPAGWYSANFSGTKEECLAHIETVWKDITPKSVREQNRQYAERNTTNTEII